DKSVSIWVTLELVLIVDPMKEAILSRVKTKLPELDVDKIVINATHTHTAPSTRAGNFILPEGVHTVEENIEFIANQVVEGIRQAWETRAPGSVTWGQGQAKLGVNRRAVYYDGSAKMYGETELPEFHGIEGVEDHDVGMLYFWDESDALIAICI